MTKTDFLVIGAGAAGLMAAIKASDEGLKVTILESMPRPARETGNFRQGTRQSYQYCPFCRFSEALQ
jgi:succinate dehydrogenase/fumarate reductase flavoprotein subunit